MASIEICSPVALGPAEARPLAARVPTLRDKVLGIRVDRAWRSFHVVADEIASFARQTLGVRDVVVFDPDVRLGSPAQESAKIAAFARAVDAAVVGLGT
jgi:hypothetical protein